MDYKKALRESCICLSLKSTTPEGIITEIIDLLAEKGKIKDRNAALRAVLERERKMSTGMQNGVAIPHGKTDAVDELVTAICIKKEGVDFGALDGQPSRIFIMTLSPLNRTGPHIQFLAEIGKVLNSASVRERLLQATSPEEVIRILEGSNSVT
jgi:PTS system nitrogen regulatory IIA component